MDELLLMREAICETEHFLPGTVPGEPKKVEGRQRRDLSGCIKRHFIQHQNAGYICIQQMYQGMDAYICAFSWREKTGSSYPLLAWPLP